jgi:hypothetical protein
MPAVGLRVCKVEAGTLLRSASVLSSASVELCEAALVRSAVGVAGVNDSSPEGTRIDASDEARG